MRRGASTPPAVLAAAVALVGVVAGLGGAAATLLLHLVEHAAYGFTFPDFLEAVQAAPPGVRFGALTAAGVIGATGWWALQRFGRPVVVVEQAVAGARMPAVSTASTVLLQLTVVGLGASIGRELAPRLLGALGADRIADALAITPQTRRLLVACGAGAGLAAVYDVPLGGAVFALEVLLLEVRPVGAVAAIATSGIATIVARVVVPAVPLYAVTTSTTPPAPGWLVWIAVVGPLLGLAGAGFDALARRARRLRPRPSLQLVVMPVVFAAIGALAIVEPLVLGNGRALAQSAFGSTVPLGALLLLAACKALATSATVFSGADGGTLTPSVSIGAALGAAAGVPVLHLVPGLTAADCAVVGAAAFLAATMQAPLTATVLLVGFTAASPALLLPIVLAVAAATATGHLVRRGRGGRPEDETGVDGG